MPAPLITETKTDRAYRLVRGQILDGSLTAGSVIPQREVAAACGVSTTPLREALRRLTAEGLVDIDAHRNATVARLSADVARDLFEIRLVLEPMAAGLCAERRSATDLREIREALAALSPLPTDATQEQLGTHRRFHAAIYRGTHNESLAPMLETLWDRADRYRMLALQAEQTPAARPHRLAEHERLVELIERRDAPGARALMAHHVETSLWATAAIRLTQPEGDVHEADA